MPILTIQQRMTEVGRIRLGEQVPAGRGTRPKRLERFRLTSHARGPIDSAAAEYGGTVNPWQSPAGPQWQLTIERDVLDVIVAPGESFSQWFELWSGGGCERRCNGINLETSKGRDVRDEDRPCECPQDPAARTEAAAAGEACKPTTRLSVWLPRLQGLGVWRAETHGFYAAAELPGVVGFLQGLAAQGYRPIAGMRIATRSVKRPGQQTKTFSVLEVDLPDVTLAGLLSGGMAIPGEARPVIGPGGVAQIGPGARAIGPGGEIAAQAAYQPFSTDEAPTGRVPARGARAPRPGTGTSPELPAQSDMRRPAPQAPRSSPDPGNAPPPFPIDEDEDGDVPFSHPAAAAEPALEAVAPLTFAEFRDLIRAEERNPEDLVAIIRSDPETYGEVGSFRDLTDAQRGRLYVEATRRHPRGGHDAIG